MAVPDFTMRELLEAGAHFGHQTHRWNPKMAPYIYGARNNVHIIDLSQTVPLLHQALKQVSDVVSRGGRVLFVGTKRQASDIVADAAQRSAQYYVNSRWLGGMLTNWKTISNSIQRLRKLDELLASDAQGFTKKERLNLEREREKLDKALGGIKDMGSTPDLMFVIDTNKEAIAIHRFELRPGQGGLPDPRQRRRCPRNPALLRPDRQGCDRRHRPSAGRARHRYRRFGRGSRRAGTDRNARWRSIAGSLRRGAVRPRVFRYMTH
jgi:ribosomal protein S2